MDRLPQNKEEFLVFYEQYKIYFQLAYVFIGLIVGLSFLNYITSDRTPETVSQAKKYEKSKSELEKTFAILDEPENVGTPDRPNMVVHLFLKDPFMPESKYNYALTDLNEYLLWKYSKGDSKVVNVKYYVYDRYNTYREHLLARDIAEYRLDKLDEKKYESQVEMIENSPDNYTNYVRDFASTKTYEVDYSEFVLDSHYNQISERDATLSDEEMDLMLKMTKYDIILAGINSKKITTNNFSKAYLLWELGVIPYNLDKSKFTEGDYIKIVAQIDAFKDRYLKNFTNRYGSLKDAQNEDGYNEIRQDLAISNPKFVAFLETGVIYTTDKDARKALVNYDKTVDESIFTDIDRYYLKYYDIFLEDAKKKLLDDTGSDPSEEDLQQYLNNGGKKKILDISGSTSDSSSSDSSNDDVDSNTDSSTQSDSTSTDTEKDNSDSSQSEDSSAFSDDSFE